MTSNPAGSEAYLGKPFQEEELLRNIRRLAARLATPQATQLAGRAAAPEPSAPQHLAR